MINLLGKSPKILVIGDLMIDHYLWGSSNRISPEAPIPIINIDKENNVLGGAGNVINNLISFGARVDVISVLGDCKNSEKLKSMLSDINIDTKYLITEPGRINSQKTRIIAGNQQVMRFDQESAKNISQLSQNLLIANFKKIVKSFDSILLSDYGKGVLTNELTQEFIKTAKKNLIKVLVDPKGSNYEKYRGAYLLTPNKKEASEASKIEIKDESTLLHAISKLKSKYDLDISLITLSEDGVAIYDDELRTYPTKAQEVFDVTGAGDTVFAALGFALSCGVNIDKAVKFSNLAAGIVVGKIGSSTTTLNEIIQYESSFDNFSSEKRIKTLTEITNLSNELKTKGKKIIFTNGCFDLLHTGHVQYLEAAKSFGDILIIGLNSDRSVSTLKGEGRPINLQIDRAQILAALEVVDYVVIFDEDTPHNLINAIKPHILVKGGDYEGKKVVGQDLAMELKLIKFIENKSTSKTIRKIKQS
jgi:D-beta-D-heptose 7-phosphate kinase / D-beta-D-heptose 1-phosphate adenosyltransferase